MCKDYVSEVVTYGSVIKNGILDNVKKELTGRAALAAMETRGSLTPTY